MIEVAGRRLALVGRLATVPDRAAVDEAERRGATVRRAITRGTELVVVGRGARTLLGGGRLFAALEQADEVGARTIGEITFLRALGLLEPASPEPAALALEQLLASTGLDQRTVRLLQVFDLIGGEEGRCSFRDLVTAREVARLLRENVSLGDILETVGQMSRADPAGHPLARHKLVCDEDGRLAVRAGRGLAELDGQLRLPLPEAHNPSIDVLFEIAEEAEQEGDWEMAEAFYRRCLDLDRRDPVIPFNLATVLHAMGRLPEARWFLELAVGIDPGFAEAWSSLAALAEEEGRHDLARAHLRRAVAADPEYADPVYTLAHGHFEAGEFDAAAEWWRRYLELDPDSERGEKARRALRRCQQHLHRVT